MALIPSTSLLGYKFSYAPHLYVIDCNGWIYYVVHRFQLISRTMIHLGVHKHHVAIGKCTESMHEIKSLNVKEVDRMLDAKIFSISLGANKTFLTKHLFNEMQVVGLQLVVQEGEMTFHLQINTTTHQQLGGWHLISPLNYFPPCWCPTT